MKQTSENQVNLPEKAAMSRKGQNDGGQEGNPVVASANAAKEQLQKKFRQQESGPAFVNPNLKPIAIAAAARMRDNLIDEYNCLSASQHHAPIEDWPEDIARQGQCLRSQIGHDFMDERDRRHYAFRLADRLSSLACEKHRVDELDQEYDQVAEALEHICRQGWHFPPPLGWEICTGWCGRYDDQCRWCAFNEPFELWKQNPIMVAEYERQWAEADARHART